MEKRKIGERQRWAWLLAGSTAVMAAHLSGISWPWVLPGTAAVAGYYIYMDARLPFEGAAALLPKALAVPVLLWTVFAMAWTANLSVLAFPMHDGFPGLGWIVLALAAWGSRKGAAACAACAGVLCLFLLVLYGTVVVFAVPDVKWENLRVYGSWQDGLRAAGLAALPAAVWFLPCKSGTKGPFWKMAAILPLGAAVLSAVTAGVLAPVIALSHPAPLYSVAQSVSLFGVVERIESLLSAAMVMGVFCLLSAMACACGALGKGRYTGAVACGAAAVLMGAVRDISLAIIGAGCVLFWMILPMAAVWRKCSAKANGKLCIMMSETGQKVRRLDRIPRSEKSRKNAKKGVDKGKSM